ncbi:MAG: hypothetical protein K1060chlam2_01539 [Chlamydiae bacterium]|nr:hypothetical protein [Chlamydiota bacterium]
MKWVILFLLPCLCFSHEVPSSYTKLKHREHSGVGYSQGYSSIDVQITFVELSTFSAFFNPRSHVFNDGRLAFNVGVGGRYQPPNKRWMVGGNGYYDYRSEKIFSPQQIGGGLELFYSDFAWRFNGYSPIGTRKKAEGKKRQVALSNVQGEVEKKFIESENFTFFAALGAYYLPGRSFKKRTYGKAWGSQLRLSTHFWKRIEVGFETTYDRIFTFTFQGYLSFKIPFGESSIAHSPNFYRPVIRNEIIPVSH